MKISATDIWQASCYLLGQKSKRLQVGIKQLLIESKNKLSKSA